MGQKSYPQLPWISAANDRKLWTKPLTLKGFLVSRDGLNEPQYSPAADHPKVHFLLGRGLELHAY